MRDNQPVFLDSNILIYRSFGSVAQKQNIQKLFQKHDTKIFISVQVLNEFINVSIKKKLIDSDDLLDGILKYFVTYFRVSPIESGTVLKAIDIHRKYKLSYYDSLIAASAFENGCKILYSEDMHHGLLILGKLKIVNPFV